jgi:predicted ATPase
VERGSPKVRSIAVTGGPGAGKSTLASLVEQRLGGRVVVVPEVATHLLGGFFPPVQSEAERRSVQRAIYHLQVALEDVHVARAGAGVSLLFDRGLVDGAAYWPEGAEAFFAALGGSLSLARSRYDAVVFLETAAAGGLSLGDNNRARVEDRDQALELDARLRGLWEPHGSFFHVPYSVDFAEKLERAVALIDDLVAAP